jgi:outer membrane protein TolC
MEALQSFCSFKAKEIIIPAVTIPFGKRTVLESLAQEANLSVPHVEEALRGGRRHEARPEVTEAFARLTQRTVDETDEVLTQGSVAKDASFRSMLSRHMEPLADRVKEAMNGIETYGMTITAVVLEMADGVDPLFLVALQDLLPDQYLISFESLGLTRFAPVEATQEFVVPNGPEVEEGGPEAEEARSGSLVDSPAYRPYRPLERDYVPPDSGFLSWLAFLSALAFIGLCGFLWYSMNQMNHRLDAMTIELQRIHQDQIANAGAGAFRGETIPPLSLPPDTTLPMEEPEPSVPNGPISQHKEVTGLLPYLPNVTLPPALAGNPSAIQPLPPATSTLPPITGQETTPNAPNPAPASPPETTAPTPLPPIPNASPIEYRPISPLADRLTVEAVMQKASERSFVVNAAKWRELASDAVRSNNLLPYRFQWGASGNLTNSGGALSSSFVSGLAAMGVYGGMDIDISHRKPILKAMQRADHAQAEAAVRSAKKDAEYQAANAFLDAISAEEEAQNSQELLTVLSEQLRVVRQRFSQGMASRLDVEEAVNRLETARNQVTTAMANQERAELALGQVSRVKAGYRVEPKASVGLFDGLRSFRISNQDPFTLAVKREDVKQAAANVALRKAQLDLAKKGKKPTMSAYGGLSAFGTGQSGLQPIFGLRFTLPFNDGGQNKAVVKEEEAVLGEGQTLYQLALNNAVSEITAAQVDAKRSRKTLDSSVSALNAGREAVRVASQRYQGGFASFTDLLQAVTQLDSALHAYAENRRSWLRAQLQLLHAAGWFDSSGSFSSGGKGI